MTVPVAVDWFEGKKCSGGLSNFWSFHRRGKVYFLVLKVEKFGSLWLGVAWITFTYPTWCLEQKSVLFAMKIAKRNRCSYHMAFCFLILLPQEIFTCLLTTWVSTYLSMHCPCYLPPLFLQVRGLCRTSCGVKEWKSHWIQFFCAAPLCMCLVFFPLLPAVFNTASVHPLPPRNTFVACVYSFLKMFLFLVQRPRPPERTVFTNIQAQNMLSFVLDLSSFNTYNKCVSQRWNLFTTAAL